MNEFQVGDRVVRTKSYTAYGGSKYSKYNELQSGTVLRVKIGVTEDVEVQWDQVPTKVVLNGGNNSSRLDADCLELEEISEAELAEVYKILGVKDMS